MNPEEKIKSLLAEINEEPATDPNLGKALRIILESPSVLSRAEAPAGYERALCAAVFKKIEASKRSSRKSGSRTYLQLVRQLFVLPKISWILTPVLAIGLVFLVAHFERNEHRKSMDLLAHTIQKGGPELTSAWLSTVGDSADRIKFAKSDFQGLSKDLAEIDQGEADKVLVEMARSVGHEL